MSEETEQEQFQAKMEQIIEETRLTANAKIISLNLLRQGILWGWFKEVVVRKKVK